MTNVLTYGTFDLFHVDHVRLLKRAASFGDRLIVGCSTDEFNARKGKASAFTYEERSEILASCQYVEEVIPEEHWEQKPSDIRKYNIETFVMGDDWAGKFDDLQYLTKVIYLPRTDGVSTTQVKDVINTLKAEKKQQLLNATDNIRNLIATL